MIYLTTNKCNKNNLSNKKKEKNIYLYELSATQILIIQMQPHSPQNTYTYVKNVEKKKAYFVQKADR